MTIPAGYLNERISIHRIGRGGENFDRFAAIAPRAPQAPGQARDPLGPEPVTVSSLYFTVRRDLDTGLVKPKDKVIYRGESYTVTRTYDRRRDRLIDIEGERVETR